MKILFLFLQISEYYSCRWDCPAVYKCTIELLTEKLCDYEVVFDSINFTKLLENEDQNEWFKVIILTLSY
jgi:hypothetical protein